MKKVLLGLLLVLTITLTGCDQVEGTITDLQDKLTTVTTDLNTAVDTISDLDETLTAANTTITELQTSLTEATTSLDDAEAKIQALEAEIALTNAKIKNALTRDTWTQRKVTYNPDWTSNNAEYCFGVFDTDWTTLTDDDYKTTKSNVIGLTFVITIESVEWGTEVFAKDSCGNYSNFLFDNSMYAFYSAPFGYFEEGATYEVVLYKDVYFAGSPAQLGFLPEVDLVGDFNSYPEDLTGIQATKK